MQHPDVLESTCTATGSPGCLRLENGRRYLMDSKLEDLPLAALCGLPLAGPELHDNLDKPS